MVTKKISKKMIYSDLGEKILKQLGSEDSYTFVFSDDSVQLIAKYKSGTVNPEQFSNYTEFLKDVINPVMDEFIEHICPMYKDKNQSMNWVVKEYLGYRHNGQAILAEDLYKMKDELQLFEGLKKSKVIKSGQRDLLNYKTYFEFQEVMEPFMKRKKAKEAKRKDFSMSVEDRAKIMAESTIIYDGVEGKVVMPHSHEASRYWGSNTKWCISGKDGEVSFEQYMLKSPTLIVIPKGGEDNKLGLVKDGIYNAADKEQEAIPSAHSRLLEKAMLALSTISRNNLGKWFPYELYNGDNTKEKTHVTKAEVPEKWKESIKRVSRGHFGHIDKDIREDSGFIACGVNYNGWLIQFGDEEVKKNEDIAFDACMNAVSSIAFMDETVRSSERLGEKLLKESSEYAFSVHLYEGSRDKVYQPSDDDVYRNKIRIITEAIASHDFNLLEKIKSKSLRHVLYGDAELLFGGKPEEALSLLTTEMGVKAPVTSRFSQDLMQFSA